jgi:hypothetical protein
VGTFVAAAQPNVALDGIPLPCSLTPLRYSLNVNEKIILLSIHWEQYWMTIDVLGGVRIYRLETIKSTI